LLIILWRGKVEQIINKRFVTRKVDLVIGRDIADNGRNVISRDRKTENLVVESVNASRTSPWRTNLIVEEIDHVLVDRVSRHSLVVRDKMRKKSMGS
jgi:hypothetical protein